MNTWMRFLVIFWLAIGSAFAFWHDDAKVGWVSSANLPPEAQQTLTLIKTGGPFPYRRDGIVFGNYEKKLPIKQRGYYTEYTVRIPGRHDRGPRRIIAGERGEYYYTEDHYRSFRLVRE